MFFYLHPRQYNEKRYTAIEIINHIITCYAPPILWCQYGHAPTPLPFDWGFWLWGCEQISTSTLSSQKWYTAVQRQTAVTDYLKSEQLLLFFYFLCSAKTNSTLPLYCITVYYIFLVDNGLDAARVNSFIYKLLINPYSAGIDFRSQILTISALKIR